MTVQSAAEHDPLVAQNAPLLHEAIPYIAHSQIRNRGTIGGSIAHADPASELPVICIALNARLHAQSKSADRWIEAKDFFTGLFSTSLQTDELLVEIEFPKFPKQSGYAFIEIARRHGDYAMAGVAALLEIASNGDCAGAKLVYLNVGDGPVEGVEAASSLVGRKPGEVAFKEAAQIASQKDISPFGNLHSSADFQRHLSFVLTKRVLAKAFERARFAQVQ
jgi:carbon-monoxide dehydrogenase medium subunit